MCEIIIVKKPITINVRIPPASLISFLFINENSILAGWVDHGEERGRDLKIASPAELNDTGQDKGLIKEEKE